MKKLLILTQNYPPYVRGGAEISTALMAKYMQKIFDIKVGTCEYTAETWTHEGIKVTPFLIDMYREVSNLKELLSHYLDMLTYPYKNYVRTKKILTKLQPDIIQCVFGAHYFLPCIISAIHSSKPVIIDVRDYGLFPIIYKDKSFFRYVIYRYEKFISDRYLNSLKNLSKKKSKIYFITISEYLKKQLVDYGYPENKIYVVPNLLPDILNASIKKASHEKSIAFAGRLVKEKGIWVAVKAFEQLKDKEIIFYIAGDGQEKINIEKYVNTNKLMNIKILGKLTNREVLELYNKVDIIIAPSIWSEPFGRFIQESYATLTPCIATNVGGIPEGIENFKTGLLVEPNNPNMLAKAISELLTNKKLYNKIILNLKLKKTKVSPEVIVSQRVALYNELLKHN